MDLSNKGDLVKYLKQSGLWAKKSLGQNFLVDKKVLSKIIESAELKPTDTVLEIGPGIGTLTQELIKHAGKIIAVEKDDELARKLNVNCQLSNCLIGNRRRGDVENIEILNQDILDFDLTKLIQLEGKSPDDLEISGSRSEHRDYKLVSNIPYNITSKILEKFLTAENKPELIVLLVQKEVAERICAKPGQTSVLSISVQYYGKPEIVEIVKSSSFFPEPNVESSILKITNIKSQITKAEEKEFFKIVRAGFHARRKTLINNLAVGTNLDKKTLSDILKKMGLSEKVRAQELSVREWVKLTKELKN